MRFAMVGLSLGAAVLAGPIAQAEQATAVSSMECIWRGLPASVRVSLLRDVKSADDLDNFSDRMKGLSDDALVAAGNACGVDVAADPARFGAFAGARTLVESLGARLRIDYGAHQGQLDALGRALDSTQRKQIRDGVLAGGTPGPSIILSLLEAAEASGMDLPDDDAVALAVAYAMGRVIADEIAR